jgi:hypothetical protein
VLSDYAKRADKLDLAFVYLSEAHAEDEWPIGNNERTDIDSLLWTPAYLASKTLEERAERAKFVATRFQFPKEVRLYVDQINVEYPSTFEYQFGAWPTGFYLMDADGVLLYIVEPNNGFFELDGLWKAVDNHNKQQ